MRASSWRSGRRWLSLALSSFLAVAPSAAQAKPAAAETVSRKLDPAFRLPAGGRAAAGPLIDATTSPAAAWLLSEDRSLYILTETGVLQAKIELRGKPDRFLALDGFGRALVILDGSWLAAYTRTGREVWRARVSPPAGGKFLPPSFGSDGRLFFLSGNGILCLNPAGRRLWSRALGALSLSAAGVDGAGNSVAASAEGSVFVTSPYGAALLDAPFGHVTAIAPMGAAPGEPRFALGTADGRALIVGAEGRVVAEARAGGAAAGAAAGAAVVSLFWDGAALYCLDASGVAFALGADGAALWSTATGCRDGLLAAFEDRLVAQGSAKAASLDYSGVITRSITIPNGASRAVLSPEGLAFSPGVDWVLAAYRFERRLGAPRRPATAPYPLPAFVGSAAELSDPRSREAGRQLALLADIEKKLRSGSIGVDEPSAAAYCAAVALGKLDSEGPQSSERYRGNPLPRVRALFLLGQLGSPAYRATLAEALERDADEAVRGAACDALAAIGVDPGGATAAAFLKAAAGQTGEQVALALIENMERMALSSGASPGEDAVRALLKLADEPFARMVRDRATTALGRIAGVIR